MAWTTPKTWVTGEALTASDLNTHVRDNLDFLNTEVAALAEPPTDEYTLDESTDYTTTATSFVPVDNTKLALTITTSGGDVLIGFHGEVNMSTTTYIHFDVEIDGLTYIGGEDGLTGKRQTVLAYTFPVSFVRLVQGLSAGEHTFELHWKIGGGTGTLYAGAGTANSDSHPQFWVREVS